MRLFYDQYTTLRRGDVLLLTVDFVATVAALLFASGACYRGMPEDAVLLGLWAVIPRCVAKFLGWFERPQDFLLSLMWSTILVLFTVVLMFAGWELIWEAGRVSS